MASSRRLLDGFLIPDDLAALKSSAKKSDQVTDYYLADLAASKGMNLATLDQGNVHGAVEVIELNEESAG